jgi:TRAP transporter 4TM/12TM fusion protein
VTGNTRTFGLADGLVAILATTMCIACILWNLETPTRLGYAVLTQQYMALQLGLALTIAYLRFGFKGEVKDRVGAIDTLVAVTVFVVLMYAAWYFSWLLTEQAYRPWQITVIGAVVTVTVMEGIRRRAGWMLFAIVAIFLVYALFANMVPGRLIGKELSPVRLVQYVGFDPSAVFSTPLAVGTIIVLLFVFFGQLLFAAGGGAFFTDLAMAATGRSRGGSAKISVVGSALFGSISGSAVSNVVTTGVITIPLMQRGGYSKRDAGAIEAVASTGGQLTPPIMGAAAFLMAEFLDVSYLTVASAALLPALIYYFSVFLQVDLIAGRDGIRATEDVTLTTREVLVQGWHFLVPFGILIAALFWWRLDPEDSALLASAAIIAVGFMRGYRGERLSFRKLGSVLVDTGVGMVDLILVVAAAGFVIGVLNITGLGFALTLMLVDAVGSNVVLLLLISAVTCTILGMGMPTSGVYVLLAALVAPSLVEAGIQPIAAHLFILYFGMMSMITPPVALAAFAAATITKENPLSTGLAAMRIGWASFMIPFIFVATPALLLYGSAIEVVSALGLTATGIAGVTAGMVGFWGTQLDLVKRLAFFACGFMSLPLGFFPNMTFVHWPAALVVVALAVWLKFRNGQSENEVKETKQTTITGKPREEKP